MHIYRLLPYLMENNEFINVAEKYPKFGAEREDFSRGAIGTG